MALLERDRERCVETRFATLVCFQVSLFFLRLLALRDGSAATAAPTEDPRDSQVSWIRLRAALVEGPVVKAALAQITAAALFCFA